MPHVHTMAGHLGAAITTPVPGTQVMPELERQTRKGKARDPHGVRKVKTVAPLATIEVPFRGPPADEPPGLPKAARHPVQGVGIVRRWGAGEWDQWNRGLRGELNPVASTPKGEQVRVSNVRGNTFRLPPQPWDAAQFVGVREAPEE